MTRTRSKPRTPSPRQLLQSLESRVSLSTTMLTTGLTIAEDAPLIALNNKIIFQAADSPHGSELWISDGTPAGTSLLKDLTPGPTNSAPKNFTLLGNTLYFTDNTNKLWQTDGTANGTQLVPSASNEDIRISQLASVENGIVAIADTSANTYGQEIWGLDDVGQLTLLADINPGAAGSDILYLTVSKGWHPTAYFTATNPTHGRELWTSDGTIAGTRILFETATGSDSLLTEQSNLAAPQDNICLLLPVADNTLVLVTPANSDQGFLPLSFAIPAAPSRLIEFNRDVLIQTRDLNGDWHFAENYSAYADFDDPSDSVNLPHFYATVATVNDPSLGREPRILAYSTPSQTFDLNPAGSSNPQNFTAGFLDIAFFSADDGTHGRELYYLDARSLTSGLLADINLSASSNPSSLLSSNQSLFFTADDGVHFGQLWLYTPSATTTTLSGTASNNQAHLSIQVNTANLPPTGKIQVNGGGAYNIQSDGSAELSFPLYSNPATFNVTYIGDALNASSTSPSITVTQPLIPTLITLEEIHANVFTFHGTLTSNGQPLSGSVQVTQNASFAQTANVSNGNFTLYNFSGLPLQPFTLTYAGTEFLAPASLQVTPPVFVLPPPSATLPNAHDVSGVLNNLTYTFRVEINSQASFNTASLANAIVITGPNGFNQTATLLSVDPPLIPFGISNSKIAQYSFTAPGGSWDAPDAGTYSISILPNTVANSLNDYIPGSTLATFTYSPDPLFSERLYLQSNPDIAQAVSDGKFASGYQHFSLFGGAETRTFTSIYDEQFYLAHNSDIAQAVAQGLFQSGLQHFLAYGQNESRAFSAYFNDSQYLAANSDVAAAVQAQIFHNGLQHYLNFGRREGRSPVALFDPKTYANHKLGSSPSPDTTDFSTLLDDFILNGQSQGLSPSTVFDHDYYLAHNADVAAALNAGFIKSAFDHYLRFGQYESRRASESFDPVYYLQQNDDVAQALSVGLLSPIEHYLLFGQHESRPAFPPTH